MAVSIKVKKKKKHLIVTFNSNATREIVQYVINSVTYHNSSKNSKLGSRTIEFKLTDGDGRISQTLIQKINIIPQNRSSIISVPGSQKVKENTELYIKGIRLNADNTLNINLTLKVTKGTLMIKTDVPNGLNAN